MYSLLIADDNYEICKGLSKYIPWEDIGFRVVGIVEDGAQALEFIKKQQVDLLLCDIIMPFMDGIEVADKIISLELNTKIVIMSAYRSFEYAQKAIVNNVKAYITKPIDNHELYEVFRNIKADLDAARNTEHAVQKAPAKTGNRYVDTVIDYLASNYRYATLEKAAQLSFISPSYLSKIFKEKTGSNYIDYVNRIRLNHACEMLQTPENTMHKISEKLGYSSTKSFTRAFKRHFGMSPSEYLNAGGYGIVKESEPQKDKLCSHGS